jgi:membrane-associated protease RseP (regulator of RpoE activity)
LADPSSPVPAGDPWSAPRFAWEAVPAQRPRRSAWRAWGLNLLLFVLTAASVYLSGGPRLAIGLVSILLAHEMGHYIACRIYRVDATLPFFIPAPFLSLVGTLGAFIRIRGRIPHRRALFDIGIAGPLAGFVVCLPVLLLGILESRVVLTDLDSGIYLGEPLLFQWAVRALRGPIPDAFTLSLGPLGLAAWFGLLVTALNLLPIGQLDGGHVTYALLRRRAALISRIGSWVCLLLIYFGPNWLVWSILLRILGRRHPPTWDDVAPVGRGRIGLGIFGLLVFVMCFVPNPIVFSWREFFEAVGLFPR